MVFISPCLKDEIIVFAMESELETSPNNMKVGELASQIDKMNNIGLRITKRN